jgi:hypothetical protein
VVVEPPISGCGFLNLGFEKLRRAPACMNAITYGGVHNACEAALMKASSSADRPLPTPIWSKLPGQPTPSPASIGNRAIAPRL